MKVKRYTGKSLPLAIQKARMELGEDIVLLESRAAANSGVDEPFEVTVGVEEAAAGAGDVKPWSPPVLSGAEARGETPAAAEESPTGLRRRLSAPRKAPAAYRKAAAEAAQAAESRAAAPATADSAADNVADSDRDRLNDVLSGILTRKPDGQSREDQILEELVSLRRQMDELARRTVEDDEPAAIPEPFNRVYRDMELRGVGEELAERFVRGAMAFLADRDDVTYATAANAVKLEMQHLFKPYKFGRNPFQRRQEVVLLLGLTGVGKTVSAMKLANHKDLFGKRSVGIVSTETYGLSEELKTFARMTGMDVVEARSFNDIQPAMASLKDKDVVIVDTPGRSPFAPNYLRELERYRELLNPSDIFLVLSMSTDVRDLFLCCGLYAPVQPTGYLFTKFDETTQPGKLFSVLDELKLPVVSVSEGERVFMDAQAGNLDFVFKKLLDVS